jgi:hypothetical protein
MNLFGKLGAIIGGVALSASAQAQIQIKVTGSQSVGVSSYSLGTNHIEAPRRNTENMEMFKDRMRELGFTNYRVFSGMGSYEPTDDNKNYGYPTWEQFTSKVKSNHQVLDPSKSCLQQNLAAQER